MFHTGNAHGVCPSEVFSSRVPTRPSGPPAPPDVGREEPANPGRRFTISGHPEPIRASARPAIASTCWRQHATGRATCLARVSPQSYGWVRRPGAPCGVTRRDGRRNCPSIADTARRISRPVARPRHPGPVVVWKCRRPAPAAVTASIGARGPRVDAPTMRCASRRPVPAHGHRSLRIDRLASAWSDCSRAGVVPSCPSRAVRHLSHPNPQPRCRVLRSRSLRPPSHVPRVSDVSTPGRNRRRVGPHDTRHVRPASGRSEDRPSTDPGDEVANSPSGV